MRLSLVFLAVLALGLTSVSASVTNCKNESSILIYGSFVNYETQTQWPQWLRDNIPGAVVNFPDAMPTITLDLLSPYDLVVFANLRARTLSADEVAATNSYFQAGGAAICLAGWTNDNEDIAAQEQIFGGLGIHYDNTTLISLQETVGSWNFNPNNPLTQGLGNGWMHFRGGRATTPYTGAGTSTIFASGISLYDPNTYSIGQTVVLPSGGKVVLWGDEWALFVGLYSQPGCVDAQFWKNAVAWASDICVPGAQVSPCDTKKVVSSSCTSISHSENSKGFTLSFSSSATNCD